MTVPLRLIIDIAPTKTLLNGTATLIKRIFSLTHIIKSLLENDRDLSGVLRALLVEKLKRPVFSNNGGLQQRIQSK